MAGFYTAALSALLNGEIDLINDKISAMLINLDEYTVDLANHATQDDVDDAAVWSLSTLTGKTIDATTFRADDTVFVNVAGVEVGDAAGAIIIFLDLDTKAESTLIAYIDNAPEFPAVLDGENVTAIWDTGIDGIFRL